MKGKIRVRTFRGERKYVAECLDLPVITQSSTLDQLMARIQEAISHLEGEDMTLLGLSPDPTVVATMEFPSTSQKDIFGRR